MSLRAATAGFVCSFLALIPVIICLMNDGNIDNPNENETSQAPRTVTPRLLPHETYNLEVNLTGSPLPKLFFHNIFADSENSTRPSARWFFNRKTTESLNVTGYNLLKGNSTASPLLRDFPDLENSTESPLPKLFFHNIFADAENSTRPSPRWFFNRETTETLNSTDYHNSTASPLLREFPDYQSHPENCTKSSNETGHQMSRSELFKNSSHENFLNGTSIRARQGFQKWENCPACGILQRNRIVGGRQAAITEFPWTVSIRKDGTQHCGASIINQNYVLTAAHCVRGHNIKKMEAIAAVTDVLDQRAFRTKIAEAKIHENFEPTIYDYDVAVMRVTNPFPLNQGVKAVCLPDPQEDPTGQRAIVSGWGALRETDTVAPDYLSKLEVPVVDNEQCAQAPGMRTQVITPRMLCAGFVDGSKDACIGDSGGPLVWKVRGQWKQIGVVSWGIGCARPGFYGIYSRVSMLLPWIASNTADSEC